MKYFKLKWLFASLAIVMGFISCDKPFVDEPLGDKGQHIIKFQGFGGKEGVGFDKSNLSFDPTLSEKQLELYLELSSDKVSNQDITVTVEFDPAALAAFNGTPGNPQYFKLPDSTYSFPSTNVIIRAGQTISEPFYVKFFPNKIDGSVNYMLPLKITKINGAPANVTIAPGTSTAFLHFIGNPLAGFYNVVGKRYNYVGEVAYAGPPAPFPAGATLVNIPPVKFASPIDAYTIQLNFANLGIGVLNYVYLITANSTYSKISVTYGDVFLSEASNIRTYVTGYIPPSPGVKAEFHIITHYNNSFTGGGNDRIIDEYFRHQ
ncbi:MAG: DUF1735 domain-containing protein [Ferruginibacter sp.]